jgi:hypothetical protein
MNSRSENDIELLYLWCKEGWQRSVLGEYHTQKQALSRFFIGAMLQTNPVLEVVRRELRRISPDVRIDMEQIKNVLANEVIKREVMEGEKAAEARKKSPVLPQKPSVQPTSAQIAKKPHRCGKISK